MLYLEISVSLDGGGGIQGEFDAVASDGPGPLRCKLESMNLVLHATNPALFLSG